MADHYEQQYLDLMRRIWTEGDARADRTGVGTRSIFGATMRFSLADDAVPLLTTKRVYWKTALREMLWFLGGGTNIRPLLEQGVHIWSEWPHARYVCETGDALALDQFEARVVADADFAVRWGDLGPVYGKQWTDWPVYEDAGEGLFRRGRGIDQIAEIVASLRANPGSRRHIIEGWNVAELGAMALPPCHKTYQFHVSQHGLAGLLYQRSCDLGLGFAFNVFGLALLTRMLAQQAGLPAHEIVWMGGDVHLYENHAGLVEEQLTRTPSGAPTLHIADRAADMRSYAFENFEVRDYAPQGAIRAPVAV